MSVWCNVDGPTAHWSDEYESLVPKAHKSDGPLVRKPISLTTHWSENPLTSPKYKNNSSRHIYFSPKSITPKSISLKSVLFVRRFIGPKKCHWGRKAIGPTAIELTHWSETAKTYWSEDPLVGRPSGPSGSFLLDRRVSFRERFKYASDGQD